MISGSRNTEAAPEDPWATDFFTSLLGETLRQDQFESAVSEHWSSGRIVVRAPKTADLIFSILQSLGQDHEVRYSVDDPELKFQSHWLVGRNDKPGAVYIKAPAEKESDPLPSRLNRPMHMHDTGRINLVIAGKALFHFVSRNESGDRIIVDCPVTRGDLIFWPAWTPHTFDALDGFSVLSSMPCYVSPAEDGYTVKIAGDPRDMDRIPHIPLAEYPGWKNRRTPASAHEAIS